MLSREFWWQCLELDYLSPTQHELIFKLDLRTGEPHFNLLVDALSRDDVPAELLQRYAMIEHAPIRVAYLKRGDVESSERERLLKTLDVNAADEVRARISRDSVELKGVVKRAIKNYNVRAANELILNPQIEAEQISELLEIAHDSEALEKCVLERKNDELSKEIYLRSASVVNRLKFSNFTEPERAIEELVGKLAPEFIKRESELDGDYAQLEVLNTILRNSLCADLSPFPAWMIEQLIEGVGFSNADSEGSIKRLMELLDSSFKGDVILWETFFTLITEYNGTLGELILSVEEV